MDERVLLMEDDPSIREMASLALERAGFRVAAAADGRDGLAGGAIEVASEVGEGSRFTLRLPVSEPLPAGDPAVPEALHDGGVDGRGGGRR